MSRQISGAKAWLEFLPLALIYKVFKQLPLNSAIKCGAVLGRTAAKLDVFNRPIALRNLEIAFPETSAETKLRILESSYVNWGRVIAEWCHLEEFSSTSLGSVITVSGLENFLKAKELANGCGIILVSGHFGNFELLQLAGPLYGAPLTLIHRPLRNPLIDELVNRTRSRWGNRSLSRKKAGLPALRLLKKGEMVGIAIDLDVRHGVFVDFFSLPASTTTSPARLSLMSGAPILPAFIVRQDNLTTHQIVVYPPIQVTPTNSSTKQDAVVETTQQFTHVFEEMVRRYPDHWNWIHPRWKTRPPGQPRFY